MVALAFIVFGFASLMELPTNLMPDLSYPTLTVRTAYPSAAPLQVEEEVSIEIEERVGNVPGLTRRSSISSYEQSEVLLEFGWGTDMLDATSQVAEALDRLRLPTGTERPQLLRYDPAQDPIIRMMLFAEGDDATLEELRSYAEDSLKPEIAKLSGIAAVRVSGGVERQLLIQPDEQRLKRNGISLADLRQAISSRNVDRSAGIIIENGRERLLRIVNPFRELEEIEELKITTGGGGTIQVKDLGTPERPCVRWAEKDLETITRYASGTTEFEGQQGVLMEVLKEGDANIIEAAARVWQALYGTQHWQSVRAGEAYPDKAERDQAWRDMLAASGEGATTDRVTAFGLLDRLTGGYRLAVLTDQSLFIEASVAEVRNAVLFGGVLAVLVIFLFLGSWKSTRLIAVAIPLSVLTTFIPLPLAGVSLNLMSLGGLALGVGMMVDNSIVVLESIQRCREEGDTQRNAAIRGTSEVASAIVASTLTSVAVFGPIVFVEGMAGQIFREQAMTVVFSLLASLIVALLVVPAYAGISRDPASFNEITKSFNKVFGILNLAKPRGSIWMNLLLLPIVVANALVVFAIFLIAIAAATAAFLVAAVIWPIWTLGRVALGVTLTPLSLLWRGLWKSFEVFYRGFLGGVLQRPALVLAAALAAAVGAVWVARDIPTELIPSFNEDELYVDVSTPEGTRLEVTDAEAVKALLAAASFVDESKLDGDAPASDAKAQTPNFGGDLKGVMIETGGSTDTTGRPIGPNRVRYVVRLADTSDEAKLRVQHSFQHAASNSTLLDEAIDVSRPTLFTLKDPVAIEIRGSDLKALAASAQAVKNMLETHPLLLREDGQPMVTDIEVSAERGRPQIAIKLDKQKLSRFGISSQDVAEELRLMNAGETISDIESRGEKLDVFLRLPDAFRANEAQLLNRIVGPDEVTLGMLLVPGGLEFQEGESEIRRVGNERVVLVSGRPNGVALGTIRSRIQQAMESERPLEQDTRAVLSGQQEELDRSSQSLLMMLGLAIFLVYVVMAVQFESLIDPLLIMGTLPLAAVGVIAFLYFTGMPASVVVMLGGIVLVGIVVNNAIVLVDYANRLTARGMSSIEAMHQAASVRVRPIAITTLTTVLGLVPMTGWLAGPLNGLADLFATLGDAGVVANIVDLLRFLGGGGEGAEVRAPLAQTIVIGLLSGTLLTLVVIPSLYVMVHHRKIDGEGA